MKLAVIIPAAGASSRYAQAARLEQGLEVVRSKLDEDLGGRPLLHRTVEIFTKVAEVSAIIVAGPHNADEMAEFKRRHGDKLGVLGAAVCAGGATHRYETVRNALALVPKDATHVAVHDAARPCVSVELIGRVIDAALRHAAVVPAVPVGDTLKRAAPGVVKEAERDPLASILGDDGVQRPPLRLVAETVDRSELFAVQTPQVFRAELLHRAYAQKDLSSTDDAQLVERLGENVVLVPGDARNIKITVPTDLVLARAIIGAKAPEAKAAHLRF
jgi:2-C-methyl-D-erythritol 4-phosphate cytidylyltransferase